MPTIEYVDTYLEEDKEKVLLATAQAIAAGKDVPSIYDDDVEPAQKPVQADAGLGLDGSADALVKKLDELHGELKRANDLVEQEVEQEQVRGLGFIARLFGRK
jgi:murein L,D-transpeptidase YcbB/YkuD